MSEAHKTYRQVILLAYPVVFSTLATTLMGLVDTLFMGWVSTASQAAVGLAGVLIWTLASFFIGSLTVVNTFVAQYHGAGQHRECGGIAWQGIGLALGFSLPLLALLPLVPALVGLFGPPADVVPIAVAYAAIRLWGVPLDLVEASLTSFMRGIGDTRTPMKVSLGAVLLNVPLNYWLVFGGLGLPALGAAGAAYATVAARAISVAVLLGLFLRRRWREAYGTGLPRLQTLLSRRVLSLLSVGAPIGVGWVLEMATWLIFTAVVARFGKIALAAHNIVLQVLHLSFMPGMALSVAATTLVGQYIGAGDPTGARRSGFAAIKLGMVYMACMGLLLLILGQVIARGFNRDPEVVQVARQLFAIAAAFQIFDAMGMVSGGILRGAGDTRWPMVVGIAFSWLVFVPLIWLLGFRAGWGVQGAWIGALAYITGMGLVLLGRVWAGSWTRYSVTPETGEPATRRPADEPLEALHPSAVDADRPDPADVGTCPGG